MFVDLYIQDIKLIIGIQFREGIRELLEGDLVWVGTLRFMDAPVDRAPIEMEEGEPAESESSSKEMKASRSSWFALGVF